MKAVSSFFWLAEGGKDSFCEFLGPWNLLIIPAYLLFVLARNCLSVPESEKLRWASSDCKFNEQFGLWETQSGRLVLSGSWHGFQFLHCFIHHITLSWTLFNCHSVRIINTFLVLYILGGRQGWGRVEGFPCHKADALTVAKKVRKCVSHLEHTFQNL